MKLSKRKLTEFYNKYCSEKIDQVDEMYRNFKNSDIDFIDRLKKKFDPNLVEEFFGVSGDSEDEEHDPFSYESPPPTPQASFGLRRRSSRKTM